MSQTINIYCDESCHLEHDQQPIMVLGAIWCPTEKAREIAIRIRDLKARHGLSAAFEIKWSKVSPAKSAFYQDVLDYFFDDDDLHFRALIVGDKRRLRHEDFDQDHDTWYYRMYFDLLKVLLNANDRYFIYLDIKDSRSARKVEHLRHVLSHNAYDFDRTIIRRIQQIRSHEVEQLQLADVLTGIISYANRRLRSNAGKVALVARMRRRSGYDLERTTLPREEKVNLFRWEPVEPGQ